MSEFADKSKDGGEPSEAEGLASVAAEFGISYDQVGEFLAHTGRSVPPPPEQGPPALSVPAQSTIRVRTADHGLTHVAARGPKDYAGPTIGFERELIGPTVKLAKEADRGVLGTVSLDGEDLVDIMSDIGAHPEYTIELRSTPCEKGDQAKLAARANAMDKIVDAIRRVDREAGTLAAVAGHQLAMRIKDCRFVVEHGVGASNQTSVGLPRAALLPGNPDFEQLKAHAEWLSDPAPGAMPRAGLAEPDKAVHFRDMVASIVAFLAKILNGQGGDGPASQEDLGVNIFQSEVKNSWGVLPRSPARDWLEELGEADRALVLANLREQFAPAADPDMDAAAKKAAKCNAAAWAYVSSRQDLAGHPVPPATIGGQPSSIFEFRSPPNELELEHVAEPPPPPGARAAVQVGPTFMAEDLARRRAQYASDDEDSSDED